MKPRLKFDFYDGAEQHADEANTRDSFKKLNYKCCPVLDTDDKWYVSIVCHGVVIGHLWK